MDLIPLILLHKNGYDGMFFMLCIFAGISKLGKGKIPKDKHKKKKNLIHLNIKARAKLLSSINTKVSPFSYYIGSPVCYDQERDLSLKHKMTEVY